MHRLREVVRPHRLGASGRVTARRLQIGRNTLRRYREALAKAGLLAGAPDALPEPEALAAALAAHLPEQPGPQETQRARW